MMPMIHADVSIGIISQQPNGDQKGKRLALQYSRCYIPLPFIFEHVTIYFIVLINKSSNDMMNIYCHI